MKFHHHCVVKRSKKSGFNITFQRRQNSRKDRAELINGSRGYFPRFSQRGKEDPRGPDSGCLDAPFLEPAQALSPNSIIGNST